MEINGNMVDDYLKRSVSSKTLEIVAKTNYGIEDEKLNEEDDLLQYLENDTEQEEWRCISVPSVNIQCETIYPLELYQKQFQL